MKKFFQNQNLLNRLIFKGFMQFWIMEKVTSKFFYANRTKNCHVRHLILLKMLHLGGIFPPLRLNPKKKDSSKCGVYS